MRLFVSVLSSWRHIYILTVRIPDSSSHFGLLSGSGHSLCSSDAFCTPMFTLSYCAFGFILEKWLPSQTTKPFSFISLLKSSAFLSFLQFITMLSLFDFIWSWEDWQESILLKYYFYVCGYFACMYIYALCTCMLHVEARRGCWVPWNWSYK